MHTSYVGSTNPLGTSQTSNILDIRETNVDNYSRSNDNDDRRKIGNRITNDLFAEKARGSNHRRRE